MVLLDIPSVSLFLISLLFIFLILRKKKETRKLPPGPWKLPFIGCIHHLLTSLPHQRLAHLAKKYGPIMHLPLGELSNIIISSPESAEEVFKTHDITFSQRPDRLAISIISYNYKDIAFAPYGDYWRQLRKICTIELFTAKRVDSFRPLREENVSKLIRSISSDSAAGVPLNFTKMLSSLTYTIVSRTAFGKIWQGQQTFLDALTKVVEAAGEFSLADLYPSVKLFQVLNRSITQVKMHHKNMDKIYQNIIDEHRARRETQSNRDNENEDLMDVLLNVQEQGDLQFPLTDDNIKAITHDMFTAGTETSATVLEWAMAELMKNPRAMEKAQEEVRRAFSKVGDVDESRLHQLNYLKSVIRETLRLHPPLPLLLPRESREECSILGYEIPVKTTVIVNVWAIGRDPKYWTEPEKFNPERFMNSSVDYKGNSFELLPFGSGRRVCPGISFGMVNVEYTLAQLLFHFDWKLPSGITCENLDMGEVFGLVVRKKTELLLIPVPCHPSN